MHLAVDVEREFFVHDERPLGLDQSSCCGGAMPLMQAGSRLFRKATQGNIVCGRGSARAGPVMFSGDYPLARRSSRSFATSSQVSANSRNSFLTTGSSAFSASSRYLVACSRK